MSRAPLHRAPDEPAARAANLQRRVRALPRLVGRPEAFTAEHDAIATELGILAMDLESYAPAGRVWRPKSKPQEPR